MTKLTTDRCVQTEYQNEEAMARAILSSLHEELSIFIDNDRSVFATISRELVSNIAADGKDTALKTEIPSNVQDNCGAIFIFQSWRESLSLDEITMHGLARLCAGIFGRFSWFDSGYMFCISTWRLEELHTFSTLRQTRILIAFVLHSV